MQVESDNILVQDLKEVIASCSGQDVSDEYAREAVCDLRQLVALLIRWDITGQIPLSLKNEENRIT